MERRLSWGEGYQGAASRSWGQRSKTPKGRFFRFLRKTILINPDLHSSSKQEFHKKAKTEVISGYQNISISRYQHIRISEYHPYQDIMHISISGYQHINHMKASFCCHSNGLTCVPACSLSGFVGPGVEWGGGVIAGTVERLHSYFPTRTPLYVSQPNTRTTHPLTQPSNQMNVSKTI